MGFRDNREWAGIEYDGRVGELGGGHKGGNGKKRVCVRCGDTCMARRIVGDVPSRRDRPPPSLPHPYGPALQAELKKIHGVAPPGPRVGGES